MYCDQCGAPNPNTARFCEKCGASFDAATTPPPHPVTAPAATRRVPPPPVSVPPPPIASQSADRQTSGTGKGALIVLSLLALLIVGGGAIALGGVAAVRSLVSSSGLSTAVAKTGLATPTSALPSAATALARATASPTKTAGGALPTPTAASGLKPIQPTVIPTRQAAPSASTAKPSAPAAADATQVYVSEKLGIRVWGPQNWKVIERSDSDGVGDVAFYANGSEQTQGMFARSGFISFQVFPLPPATEVAPEEFFMGFVDGLVTEYTTSVGTDGQLSDYTLADQKNSRYPGATTTFSITGAKGSLRYFWANHRIPNRPLAVQVACGASTERWDSVRPVCMNFYGMIETIR